MRGDGPVELQGVHAVRGAELRRDIELVGVRVDGEDAPRAADLRRLDDGQPDGAAAEDRDGRVGLHVRRLPAAGVGAFGCRVPRFRGEANARVSGARVGLRVRMRPRRRTEAADESDERDVFRAGTYKTTPERGPRGAPARRDAAAEHADLGEVRGVVDLRAGDLGDDRVLGEGRAAHEVRDGRAVGRLEARRAVGHDAPALRPADLRAEVRLRRRAEDAVGLAALGRVAGDDLVADFYRRHALADGLDDRAGLVA
mmetsp:Transcript_8414/g.28828  ORF Transcript_8414/g.28828 Transcript_8414/m.28828 type:complete len:256 (-) Transcript_8414:459-1226(-)